MRATSRTLYDGPKPTPQICLSAVGYNASFAAIVPAGKRFRLVIVSGLKRRKRGYSGVERYSAQVWCDISAERALRLALTHFRPVEPWFAMEYTGMVLFSVCNGQWGDVATGPTLRWQVWTL